MKIQKSRSLAQQKKGYLCNLVFYSLANILHYIWATLPPTGAILFFQSIQIGPAVKN